VGIVGSGRNSGLGVRARLRRWIVGGGRMHWTRWWIVSIASWMCLLVAPIGMASSIVIVVALFVALLDKWTWSR